MHLLGRGRILNELKNVVFPNHTALGHRHVFANGKSIHVSLADDQLTFTALHILQHHLQATHEVLTVLRRCRLQHFRVQSQKVRRIHRLNVIARQKRDLASLARIHIPQALNRVLQPIRGQQVRVLDVIIDRVFRPLRM